jgi:ribosomal protein S25
MRPIQCAARTRCELCKRGVVKGAVRLAAVHELCKRGVVKGVTRLTAVRELCKRGVVKGATRLTAVHELCKRGVVKGVSDETHRCPQAVQAWGCEKGSRDSPL